MAPARGVLGTVHSAARYRRAGGIDTNLGDAMLEN
jgi:hypothetical protein